MKSEIRLLSFAVPLSLFFSCTKSNPQSKTDMLASGKWVITEDKYYYLGLGYDPMDLYAAYPACKKDNYYVFGKDGTGEINEGLTKCNAVDPQSVSFRWLISSDETQISLRGSNWKIIKVSERAFWITTVQTLGGEGETISFSKI